MTWFLEDGLTPLIAFTGAAAVGFFAAGGLASTRARLVGGGLLLVAAAGPVVDAAVATPAERMTASLHRLARHVVDGDGEAAAGLIAGGEADLKSYVRRVAEKVDVEDDLRIFDVEADLLPGGRVGTTHFRANGTVTVDGGALGTFTQHRPTRWRLKWQREADGIWRVADVTMLDPISGREITLWRRI